MSEVEVSKSYGNIVVRQKFTDIKPELRRSICEMQITIHHLREENKNLQLENHRLKVEVLEPKYTSEKGNNG